MYVLEFVEIWHLSEDLKNCHTMSQYVTWRRIANLYSCSLAEQGIKLCNLSNTPTFWLALLLMSFPCSLNVNFSSMFTPRIVILSKDFTTWLSIWSNNLSTSSFIKSFGSIAIIWYLLGLACNRFTLYHCVTFSVSLFSSWTSVLIESQSCIFDGRLRTWKHIVLE